MLPPPPVLHAVQIAQSRYTEDVLVEGEKQTTQALCSSESQSPVFNRPEHVFLPVPEVFSSADVNFDRWIYVSLRLLRGHRDDYIFNSSFENPMDTPRRVKHHHQWAMGTDISGLMT